MAKKNKFTYKVTDQQIVSHFLSIFYVLVGNSALQKLKSWSGTEYTFFEVFEPPVSTPDTSSAEEHGR